MIGFCSLIGMVYCRSSWSYSGMAKPVVLAGYVSYVWNDSRSWFRGWLRFGVFIGDVSSRKMSKGLIFPALRVIYLQSPCWNLINIKTNSLYSDQQSHGVSSLTNPRCSAVPVPIVAFSPPSTFPTEVESSGFSASLLGISRYSVRNSYGYTSVCSHSPHCSRQNTSDCY